MGCIEKAYNKVVYKEKVNETTISRLRYLCADKYQYIINAFDNGTLYIVTIILFIVFCYYKPNK